MATENKLDFCMENINCDKFKDASLFMSLKSLCILKQVDINGHTHVISLFVRKP